MSLGMIGVANESTGDKEAKQILLEAHAVANGETLAKAPSVVESECKVDLIEELDAAVTSGGDTGGQAQPESIEI